MSAKPKVVVIVGPTASGKSDLAVALAKKFNGEIVSADSRQVYRGLDIGTGKITGEEMRGVPHHLLDIASPKRRFSVAEYQERSLRVIAGILRRKKVPIICGGTGLYVSSIVDGTVFPDVPPNEELRKRIGGLPAERLLALLKTLDPKRARSIDPKNPRRLVRAIEIARALGRVPDKASGGAFTPLFIGITAPKDELQRNIRRRLLRRMRSGMVAEAKRLHRRGLSWRRMEELGLEYRYLSRYLRGVLSKEQMLVELEREIVRYAKRQMTWWKRDKRIVWLKRNELKSAATVVRNFLDWRTA